MADMVRELIFDLRLVSSRDDFQREMARHFDMPSDHVLIWSAISKGLDSVCQGRVLLRILGWEGFRLRMPKFAFRLMHFIRVRHRIQELLDRFQLEVEYS